MIEGGARNVTGVQPAATCTRTAMYLVVPVKVLACEPMSSPETPSRVAHLDDALSREEDVGLLMSRWMTFL